MKLLSYPIWDWCWDSSRWLATVTLKVEVDLQYENSSLSCLMVRLLKWPVQYLLYDWLRAGRSDAE
jgi:hypothetical protein